MNIMNIRLYDSGCHLSPMENVDIIVLAAIDLFNFRLQVLTSLLCVGAVISMSVLNS